MGLRHKQRKRTAVDAPATTPAMQALLEAASEVQTTVGSSLPTSTDTPKEASEKCTTPSVTKNLDGASEQVQTTAANGAEIAKTTPTNSSQGTSKRRHEDNSYAHLDPNEHVKVNELIVRPSKVKFQRNSYAHLDPNEHAKVDDPIVRPAKRNKYDGKSEINNEGKKSHADESGGDRASIQQNESNGKAEPIEFSHSILSRLFEPDRKRVPELWEFVRLVAPGPANKPPAGQYKWGTKDAIAAYCLKCRLSFTYTPGTSKTITRHLKAHHQWNGSNIAALKKEKPALPKITKKTSAKVGGSGRKDIANTDVPRLTQRNSSKKTRKVTKNANRSRENSQENGSKRNKKAFDLLRYRQKCMEYVSSDEEEDSYGENRKADPTKALFRWCVASYQFSQMKNPLFANFCKSLDKSFQMPNASVMNALAKNSYERLQTEIKIHVSKLFPQDGNKNHEFISVSVRQVKVNSSQGLETEERIFYPVRVSFCTPMFRMKSYVIAVIPGEIQQGEDKGEDKNDKTIISPYSRAIDLALEKRGFPRENVSHVVVRGSFYETHSDKFICVLDRLDGIFGKALRSPTILPEGIKRLLHGELPTEKGSNHVQKASPSIFCTIRAHEILVASLPPSNKTETAENNASNDEADKKTHHHTIVCLLDIVTPLRDAIQTLSNDLYPTVGLAIPVLRRVNKFLHQCLLDLKSGVDVGKPMHENLKPFLTSIVEDFKKKFEPFLKTNPDLMWTMPLDPRLIAMPGLSEVEQTKVKSALATEVAKIVEVVNQKEQNQTHKILSQDKLIPTSRNNINRYSSSSTMGGIFWGDKPNDPESGGIISDQTSSVVKDAEQYAKKNVDSYFNTVHSQRQIKDSLLWWKNNQEQFPEIAMLARKWISASAVHGRKGIRENEFTNVVLASSDTKGICRMIMLHDNNDILT